MAKLQNVPRTYRTRWSAKEGGDLGSPYSSKFQKNLSRETARRELGKLRSTRDKITDASRLVLQDVARGEADRAAFHAKEAAGSKRLQAYRRKVSALRKSGTIRAGLGGNWDESQHPRNEKGEWENK